MSITDDMIERAARAKLDLYNRLNRSTARTWLELPASLKMVYRMEARAMLEAALYGEARAA